MLKFTNEQRTKVLGAIRSELINQPHLKPSKGVNLLTKAEWIQLAEDLGIDLNNFGTVVSQNIGQQVRQANPPKVVANPIGQPDLKVSGIDKQLNNIMGLPVKDLRDQINDLLIFKNNPPITEKIVKVSDGSVSEIGFPETEILPINKVRSETGSKLFGFRSFADKSFDIYNDPRSPVVDENYTPQKEVLEMFLSCASNKDGRIPDNIFLYGKAGTGKTSLPRWFCAKTGRQFIAITGNADLSIDQFFGSFGAKNGSTYWQDGLLLKAVKQPYTVLLIDEIARIPQNILIALNGVLQDREYIIPETGERIPFAEGVVIVGADNTNGQGDLTGQFSSAVQMDSSTLSRFAVSLEVSYPKPSVESKILQNKTGTGQRLCDKIVEFINLCRDANTRGDAPTLAPNFRNTVSWINRLVDGIDPKISLMACMGNSLDPSDRELLSQLFNTHIDPKIMKILVVDGELPAEEIQTEQDQTVDTEEDTSEDTEKKMPY
jgi:MoxR-like ATPase